jgi:alkylation response protein AidB-like acyl-CoA dehydrogenase
MTTTDVAAGDVTDEVNAWLEENWDPDLTVEEWWDRLGRSGWATPTWPTEWYGRGLPRADGVRVM